MKRMSNLIIAILIVVIVFLILNYRKIEISVPPPLSKHYSSDKYFCESLMGSMFNTEKNYAKDRDILKGELFKGTDKVSIEIRGNHLLFLTGASFEVGDSKDDYPFEILKVNDDILVATDAS